MKFDSIEHKEWDVDLSKELNEALNALTEYPFDYTTRDFDKCTGKDVTRCPHCGRLIGELQIR